MSSPVVVWATPLKHEAWRCYIGEKIKVRELNTGIVQVAGLDGDWEEVK